MSDPRFCSGCEFWKKAPEDLTVGLKARGWCRRYPPTPVGTEQGLLGAWPPTLGGDGCGEFVAKDTLTH